LEGEFKNIIKVASIYMATIIGAGFASGQEIVQFFSTYYEGGFYGIILAGVLFSIIGYIVLDKVYRERIRNYDELLFPMVGWGIGWIMEIAVSIFMLSVFCIMIAGMGNILSEKTGMSFSLGIVIVDIVCMVVILTDIKGIAAVSTVITPVLVAGIVTVGLYIITNKDTSVFNLTNGFNKLTNNWFFSALIYVGYNSIISIVVMCSLLPYLKTRKVGIAGGLLGGAMLCVIALILNSAISLFYPNAMSKELPVLGIVGKYNIVLSSVYTVILSLAMLVSAVTSGYCFIERVSSKVSINVKLITVVFCALAVPLSSFGFSTLIATIYPLFGYIGLFIVFAVLIQGIRISPVRLFARKTNK